MKRILFILILGLTLTYAESTNTTNSGLLYTHYSNPKTFANSANSMLELSEYYTGAGKVVAGDNSNNDYITNGAVVDFNIHFPTGKSSYALNVYNDFYKTNGNHSGTNSVADTKDNVTDLTLAYTKDTKLTYLTFGVGNRFARDNPEDKPTQKKSMFVFHMSSQLHLSEHVGFVTDLRIAPYHGKNDKNTEVYFKFMGSDGASLAIGYLYRDRSTLTYNHTKEVSHSLFIAAKDDDQNESNI